MLSAYEGPMSASLSHRQLFSRSLAVLALLALGAGLSGCADMGDTMSTAFADPAKYDLYECVHLEGERTRLSARAAELQGLMAKAETGVAGPVVAELAYRNEYISTRGQAKLAEEAWRRNKCKETKKEAKPDEDAKATPSAAAPPSAAKGARSPSKSGSAVY
jgi:hypothetical protein